MSNADTKVLTELVRCHTESATTTKLLLKAMGELLAAMSAELKLIREFVAKLQVERDAFYRTAVKVFIVIFFAQVAIIGLLLRELNMKGADAIHDIGNVGIQRAVK